MTFSLQKGVFHLAGQDFLIEPLAPSNPREGAAQPHRISRRHIWEHEDEEFISVLSTKGARKRPASVRMCGVQGNVSWCGSPVAPDRLPVKSPLGGGMVLFGTVSGSSVGPCEGTVLQPLLTFLLPRNREAYSSRPVQLCCHW